MNQTHWHVENGKLTKKEVARRNRIAKKHGVSFVYAELPEGPKSWFVGDSLGSPFDDRTGEALKEDLG